MSSSGAGVQDVSLYSTLYASSSVPRNPMDLVFTRRNVDTGNTDFPVRIPSQSPPRNQWAPVPFPEYCLTSRPMIPCLARLLPLCLARRGHPPTLHTGARSLASRHSAHRIRRAPSGTPGATTIIDDTFVTTRRIRSMNHAVSIHDFP